MVRSMMSLTTLPMSFWGYALDSTARILHMVPTKKVNKTPYEMWHGKVPNMSYLKDTQKKTMGYYFYYPLENKNLVARSARIPQALERYGFYIDAKEHELGDHAMNAEMQSMKDNQVWNLVDLPPNYKTVGSKWLFKKKTDMDGNIHTYKARLVAKGFTQTYGVDYEETFSPVADIKLLGFL
ncbi:retrotransposon protein, putative, ty1-copia subclass [Tanacetum coccineum]